MIRPEPLPYSISATADVHRLMPPRMATIRGGKCTLSSIAFGDQFGLKRVFSSEASARRLFKAVTRLPPHLDDDATLHKRQ